MSKFLFPVSILLLATGLTSCVIRDGQKVSRTQKVFKNHPIAVRVHGKYIDEDSPIDYTVQFRNSGRQIVSFDYTISDQPGVPHIDRDGPNSGLVANLYAGAEVEVVNPLKRKRVWVTLGTVTYGKKTNPELEAIYRPDAVVVEETVAVETDLLIPEAK